LWNESFFNAPQLKRDPLDSTLLSRPVMDSLTRRKAQRFQILNALYDESDGSPSALVDMYALGEKVGLTSGDTASVVEYLANEGLLEHLAMGGGIGITHSGVVQIEAARSHPDQETEYFPPVVNILNVANMVNSQIQQAGHGSQQAGSFLGADLEALRHLIEDLRGSLNQLNLPEQSRDEAQAEIATVRAQLASPKPKPAIIGESLRSIRTILEGAAGNILASALLARVLQLLGS